MHLFLCLVMLGLSVYGGPFSPAAARKNCSQLCLLFFCVDKWISVTAVSYVPLVCLIKTASSLRWCSQGLETATKQKLMLSLINTCVSKRHFLWCSIAESSDWHNTGSCFFPHSNLDFVIYDQGDNFLTILMGVLTHWRWGFLGKVAFFLANPWRIQRIEPTALRKYELSVIHIFCGKPDWLDSIICMLFVCVGSGTGPISTITPSLMK